MASRYVRERYIGRTTGGNAVRTAAYNARTVLKDERTGYLHDFRYVVGHVHHEILLPALADSRFGDPATLWSAVEFAELRINSVVARELVFALPAESEISNEDRADLVRTFITERFVSKGLAAQIDIHPPPSGDLEDENGFWHAHVLLTTRRVERDRLSRLKAKDLDPQIRHGKFGPMVTAGDGWPEQWAAHQNRWFEQKRLAITVLPQAPYIWPGGPDVPRRRRHPVHHAILEERKKLNADFARDPGAVYRHFLDHATGLDPRTLTAWLSRHLGTGSTRDAVRDQVLGLQRADFERRREELEQKTWADKVPSGWRVLTVEDIARELSSEYAGLRQEKPKREAEIRKATFIRKTSQSRIAEADKRIEERQREIGFLRRLLHRRGLYQDIETKALESWRAGNEWSKDQRWSIRLKTAQDRLKAVEQQIAAILGELQPELARELAGRQEIAAQARDELEKLSPRASVALRARQKTA